MYILRYFVLQYTGGYPSYCYSSSTYICRTAAVCTYIHMYDTTTYVHSEQQLCKTHIYIVGILYQAYIHVMSSHHEQKKIVFLCSVSIQRSFGSGIGGRNGNVNYNDRRSSITPQ